MGDVQKRGVKNASMLTDLVEISQVISVTQQRASDHASLGREPMMSKNPSRCGKAVSEPVVTSLAVAYDFRFESRTARLPPSNCAAEYRRRSGEDLKEDLDQAFRRNDRP